MVTTLYSDWNEIVSGTLFEIQCGIHVITTLNMKIVTSSCAPRVQGKPQGKSMVAPTIKSLY